MKTVLSLLHSIINFVIGFYAVIMLLKPEPTIKDIATMVALILLMVVTIESKVTKEDDEPEYEEEEEEEEEEELDESDFEEEIVIEKDKK